ncbi:hypothetical protein V1512DRAFT_220647 [Lipomyces arxii]|uniref:uncharacterized protein n=1 Tax=Lipomyces arxii TaxID=56418 RepID=UPI0034CD6D1D
MSASKLEKTLARVKQRIADQQFYEAHQALRTVAARHIKAQQYDHAIELLYHGAQQLLQAGEGGSGGDLARYMVDTYKTAKVPVNIESRLQVVTLFDLFKPDEPRRKEYIQDVVQWSGSNGDVKYGDPELFHIFGSAFANEDSPYEAEKFLLLGTKDSPVVLANMLFEWFSEDPSAYTVSFYISRAVLGYLSVGNIRDAKKSLDVYIPQVISSGRLGTNHQTATSSIGDTITVFPEYPLLNFLQLLIAVCQRKDADLFRRLRFRYKTELKDAAALDEALDRIGERFCGIQVRNQGNILSDLMGSFFAPAQSGNASVPQIQNSDLD